MNMFSLTSASLSSPAVPYSFSTTLLPWESDEYDAKIRKQNLYYSGIQIFASLWSQQI